MVAATGAGDFLTTLGIEKQVSKYIADMHLDASKRVVNKLLYYHPPQWAYLLAVGSGGMCFNLNGTEAGEITRSERDRTGRLLAAAPQTA